MHVWLQGRQLQILFIECHQPVRCAYELGVAAAAVLASSHAIANAGGVCEDDRPAPLISICCHYCQSSVLKRATSERRYMVVWENKKTYVS
ncbi:unnamed protein product [Urochloa humidicola]